MKNGFIIAAASLVVGLQFLFCAGLMVSAVKHLVKPDNERYGDMPLKAFDVQRPKEPTSVLAVVSLKNYWNYEYRSSRETHYSVYLQDGMGVNAWVEKDSPAGKRIYERCKNGGEINMVLKLAWVGPDGKPTPPGNEGVLIAEVVKDFGPVRFGQ